MQTLWAIEIELINESLTCNAGFHVESFIAFHCRYASKGNMKAHLDMLKVSELLGGNRKKKINYIGSLDMLTLPPPWKTMSQRSTSSQSNDDESNDSSMNDCSSYESDNTNRHVKHKRTT